MTPSGLALKERARSRAKIQDLKIAVRIAKTLSRKAPVLTVEDVKLHFEASGLLLAYSDRAYASTVWSAVMHTAGLRPIAGQYRRSTRKGRRGGNLNLLYARRAAA